jgi:tetratricopeptide (TPR) repeat protein
MKRVIISGVLALTMGLAGLVAQKQLQPKSKGELEALQAAFGAQDPTAKIQACENVLTKYADTQFKPILLLMIAQSYQQKGDADNAQIYAERVLKEGDPANYQAKIMLAELIAQRTKEFDLDKDEKLAQVDKYANGAIEDLKTAQKPNPQLPDDQWEAVKKDMTAQAYQALGMGAMLRKKYDVAITDFKTAVDVASTPDAATEVRLASAYNAAGKYDDAIAMLDKVMAAPNVHPAIKQFAQAERVRAMQGKGAVKPAAPAAPPAAPPAPAPKP